MDLNIFKLQNRSLNTITNKNIINSFKILSYNILAESNMFIYKTYTKNDLLFENRFTIIKSEINALLPDIIFIQEMENIYLEHFINEYKPKYDYYFETKNDKKEGLAIFYNNERYDLKYKNKINLDISNKFTDLVNNNYNFTLLNYPNIILYTILYDKILQKNIICLNLHLPFNKNRGYLKLYHIHMANLLISKLEKIYETDLVLLCGDFNLIPNSMLYNYILSYNVDFSVNMTEYSNQNTAIKLKKNNNITILKKIKICNKSYTKYLTYDYKFDFYFDINIFLKYLNNLYINDNLDIDYFEREYDINNILNVHEYKNSYYEYYKDNNSLNKFDIMFTHFAKEIYCLCDYIFYKGSNLKTINVLNSPDNKNYYIYGPKYNLFASDHIPIFAELAIINN